MRANTKKKHKMGKRFTLLIGLAAAGVMALGAQTGTAASEGVVGYKTTLTIFQDGAQLHGEVKSGVRECWQGREVIVFRKRPGPDRKLGATRSGPQARSHNWRVHVKVGKEKPRTPPLGDAYAKVTPKLGDGFVCRADTSGMLWKTYPPSMRTTGDPVDSTPPDLQLSGPMKQSPQNAPRNCPPPGSSNCDPCLSPGHACSVEVRVSHTGEAFTVRATGKLTNVKMAKLAPDGISVGPVPTGTKGNKPKVGPVLANYAQRKQVRQALAEGKNVKAKVIVKATDAAGNVATAKRTITLVK